MLWQPNLLHDYCGCVIKPWLHNCTGLLHWLAGSCLAWLFDIEGLEDVDQRRTPGSCTSTLWNTYRGKNSLQTQLVPAGQLPAKPRTRDV